jgi:HD-like signal output (HDOD) protein/CheY-like chemotaxis protein
MALCKADTSTDARVALDPSARDDTTMSRAVSLHSTEAMTPLEASERQRSVLFVDDEVSVVESLRKALYQYRKQWRVETVTRGSEALAKLQSRPFDAVVTDSRMPEMDGETLLKLVADQHPGVLRVVLSGEVSGSGVARLQRLAHHFIPKPVSAPSLFAQVQEALGAREKLACPRLQALMCRLGELPASPRTFTEISRLSSEPNTTLEQLVAVVEQDPSVAGNLLRVVNSAWFGRPTRIGSTREAVRLLGLVHLRSVVLATEVFGHRPDLEHLAQLALARLNATPALLARLGLSAWHDAAATAVVLCDVGQLIIAMRALDETRAIERAVTAGRVREAVEREVLGADHALLGGVLLRLWNLPTPLVDAVALHHEPRLGDAAPTLATFVALSCRLQELAHAPAPMRTPLLEQIAALEAILTSAARGKESASTMAA